MATTDKRLSGAKDYFNRWLWRDTITRLVTVNFVMWVIVALESLICRQPDRWIGYFAVPEASSFWPWRVYTVVTYMFVHHDFLHLFANMLWLMLFGRLFEMTQSGTRLVALYVYGGLAGAAAFLVCNALGVAAHSGLLGASCSVLAVIGAVMVESPTWRVNLLIFGEVKIIWVALVAVVCFIVLAPAVDVSAAHAAGLGVGALYVVLGRRGIDMARPVTSLLSGRKKGPRIATPRPQADDNAMLDTLLEKVSRSGYGSLTPRERQQLFDISRRIKK